MRLVAGQLWFPSLLRTGCGSTPASPQTWTPSLREGQALDPDPGLQRAPSLCSALGHQPVLSGGCLSGQPLGWPVADAVTLLAAAHPQSPVCCPHDFSFKCLCPVGRQCPPAEGVSCLCSPGLVGALTPHCGPYPVCCFYVYWLKSAAVEFWFDLALRLGRLTWARILVRPCPMPACMLWPLRSLTPALEQWL